MKTAITMLLAALLVEGSVAGCSKKSDTPMDKKENTTVKLTIGGEVFTATLSDNATSKAFYELLPLTLTMTELNGNEKYTDLPETLPTNATNPKTIETGDLMLWGSGTLVLFYKTFGTSYSYTRIGRVKNPERLSEALGAGNVSVTFSLD